MNLSTKEPCPRLSTDTRLQFITKPSTMCKDFSVSSNEQSLNRGNLIFFPSLRPTNYPVHSKMFFPPPFYFYLFPFDTYLRTISKILFVNSQRIFLIFLFPLSTREFMSLFGYVHVGSMGARRSLLLINSIAYKHNLLML